MNIQEIVKVLDAKRSGIQWKAKCPAHYDKQPSLSIGIGNNGKVIFNCFAGCKYFQIISALKDMGVKIYDN